MRSGTFWLRYRTSDGSGKYIGFGLRIETGAERTIVVDIFDIIQQVFDHPIPYLDTLLKTGSESLEATLRRRRILFA